MSKKRLKLALSAYTRYAEYLERTPFPGHEAELQELRRMISDTQLQINLIECNEPELPEPMKVHTR